jgi:hypothetical protein
MTSGAVIMHDSAITLVSNDKEKLPKAEGKEDELGQKVKRVVNALQNHINSYNNDNKTSKSLQVEGTMSYTLTMKYLCILQMKIR